MHSTREIREKYDVVISGAGPSALATAYGLMKAGMKILVLDVHDDSIRPQLVHLRSESIKILKKMAEEFPLPHDDKEFEEDQEFISKFNIDGEHYGIKDIERFIKRRLRNKENCDLLEKSEIKTIDMQQGNVTLHKSGITHSVQFKTLVGADGAKHPTADILKTVSEYDMGYHPIPSHEHLYHITASVTLKARNEGEIIKLQKIVDPVFYVKYAGHLAHLYIEESSHIKSEGKIIKACVTTSVPERIYKKWESALKESKDTEKIEEAKQEILREIQTIVDCCYPECEVVMTQSAKHALTKDPLKIQLFKSQLYEATRSYILIGGHLYVLVGDALRIPDFYQGHGVTLGLSEAQKLVELLSRGEVTENVMDEYQAFYRQLSDAATQKTIKLIHAKPIYNLAAVTASTSEEFQVASEMDDALELIIKDPNYKRYLENLAAKEGTAQSQTMSFDCEVIHHIYQSIEKFKFDMEINANDWKNEKARIIILIKQVSKSSDNNASVFKKLYYLLTGKLSSLDYFKDSTLDLCRNYLSKTKELDDLNEKRRNWVKILNYDLKNAQGPLEVTRLIVAFLKKNREATPKTVFLGDFHFLLKDHAYYLISNCYRKPEIPSQVELTEREDNVAEEEKEVAFHVGLSSTATSGIFSGNKQDLKKEKEIDKASLNYFMQSTVDILEKSVRQSQNQPTFQLLQHRQEMTKILIYDVKHANGRREIMNLIKDFLQENTVMSKGNELGILHMQLQEHHTQLTNHYKQDKQASAPNIGGR